MATFYLEAALITVGNEPQTSYVIPFSACHIQNQPQVKCWSAQSEAMPQHSLDDIDWDMFWLCTEIIEFADVVIGLACLLITLSPRQQ